MTTETFPSPAPARRRFLPIVWVPLVPCAAIAAATAATPVGFLARFFGLALLVAFGVWCLAVWGVAFDLVLDDEATH